ncbi:hypothetical protein [Hydrogenophaga sp. PAMC20947]|uniref:hypothetical protein n=1 Tax=Hydrogenophaga sp. PAMC20947 TaxID=2565558 RepID=UPI00109D89CE|nr:hypothetical protein [Hydrogenophaga sp. PAMC20947]QCB45562.1 hypothetical protein E5678_05710 [Hydrogenophaga sp. PAMC20947]
MVRQAILAPSSHNTPCWGFQIAEKSISIAPDLERRGPIVDPDDDHVYVSLGCAAGNSPLPRWLGTRMMNLFSSPASENQTYARQFRCSAAIAVFVSERNVPINGEAA